MVTSIANDEDPMVIVLFLASLWVEDTTRVVYENGLTSINTCNDRTLIKTVNNHTFCHILDPWVVRDLYLCFRSISLTRLGNTSVRIDFTGWDPMLLELMKTAQCCMVGGTSLRTTIYALLRRKWSELPVLDGICSFDSSYCSKSPSSSTAFLVLDLIAPAVMAPISVTKLYRLIDLYVWIFRMFNIFDFKFLGVLTKHLLDLISSPIWEMIVADSKCCIWLRTFNFHELKISHRVLF